MLGVARGFAASASKTMTFAQQIQSNRVAGLIRQNQINLTRLLGMQMEFHDFLKAASPSTTEVELDRFGTRIERLQNDCAGVRTETDWVARDWKILQGMQAGIGSRVTSARDVDSLLSGVQDMEGSIDDLVALLKVQNQIMSPTLGSDEFERIQRECFEEWQSRSRELQKQLLGLEVSFNSVAGQISRG
jgi:hypothetical protein